MPSPEDERRHEPPETATAAWCESFGFDATWGDQRTASAGLFARLLLWPRLGRAWWWAGLVRTGEPALVVQEHELQLPKRRLLEVRGDGLWAEPSLGRPYAHWSLGLECFSLTVDPDALWSGVGDRVPLGFDLDWEMLEPPPLEAATPTRGRYAQPATVSGQVLVGDDSFDIEATGTRDHWWGPVSLTDETTGWGHVAGTWLLGDDAPGGCEPIGDVPLVVDGARLTATLARAADDALLWLHPTVARS